MNRSCVLVAAAALGLVATDLLWAADDANPAAPATARKADEESVRKAAQELARAFEKGDAEAVAGFFTEQGEYAEEGGEPIRGREALTKAYAGFFEKRGDVKVTGTSDAIRFLGADTAVEEGTFSVQAGSGPPLASRYSSLYVREGGRWLIALLKEWSDPVTAQPSLESLAWLIGSWQSGGDDGQARTVYEWSDNKRFLHVRYSLKPKEEGAAASTGTQVIGVDPALNAIRAWTFDSEGGIGESQWTWDGERWVIESIGTLPDGTATTAVNFLTPDGKDAFTWKSVQRTAGGAELPDLGPIKVSRARTGN